MALFTCSCSTALGMLNTVQNIVWITSSHVAEQARSWYTVAQSRQPADSTLLHHSRRQNFGGTQK